MFENSDLQLSEFGDFLLNRSFCKEKNARYYVFWVKRFFRESQEWRPDSWDVHLQEFVNQLNDDPEVEDWQIEQAERAVRLYFHNFRGSDGVPSPTRVSAEPDGSIPIAN